MNDNLPWEHLLDLAWNRMQWACHHKFGASFCDRELLYTLRRSDMANKIPQYESIRNQLAKQCYDNTYTPGVAGELPLLQEKNGLFYRTSVHLNFQDHWVYLAMWAGMHQVIRQSFDDCKARIALKTPQTRLSLPILNPDTHAPDWISHMSCGQKPHSEVLTIWDSFSWYTSIDISNYVYSIDIDRMTQHLSAIGADPRLTHMMNRFLKHYAWNQRQGVIFSCVSDFLCMALYLLPMFGQLAEQGIIFAHDEIDHLTVYCHSRQEAVERVKTLKNALKSLGLMLNNSSTFVRPNDQTQRSWIALLNQPTPTAIASLFGLIPIAWQFQARIALLNSLQYPFSSQLTRYYVQKLSSPSVFHALGHLKPLLGYRFFQNALWQVIVTYDETEFPMVMLFTAWLINNSPQAGRNLVDDQWLKHHLSNQLPTLRGHVYSMAQYYLENIISLPQEHFAGSHRTAVKTL